ncbi:DDT domain-containing protein DDB_G0282237 [Brachypodium distachyon]|nr:DDT domain-containing protein DDB_G0282237 [Brachypodium distachyon]|eukprot:XP_003575146.1 DDT domain-containing protein DDB_G0282237 [Brachypodium distachyon]
MPLFMKKPFSLLEPPKDLDPKEKVFQIRFTKEIFLDYQEYVKRLNLYRQRVWTCKASGKSNLTFEEALVSEHNAMKKAQNLPKELMAHVLRMTQHSTLGLQALVDKIYATLQEDMLHAKKDGFEAACNTTKTTDSGDTKMYTAIDTSVVKAIDLVRRRAPVSRNTLKLLIGDSTSQSTPWIIHEHLAKEYGIPMDPPNDLMYGEGLQRKGRKIHECGTTDDARKKFKIGDELACVPIKYPIDDLLLSPAVDDPALLKRPPLATDFGIPRNSVGDLLMVWDFCLSFGRVLNLSPFSLADLENAICHKESNALLVEIHSAMFHLLIKDEGDYFMALKNNKRKLKLSLETWAEYLCDFLEMAKIEELSSNIATVRRGYYGHIDADMKLKILRELVEEAITTSAIREELIERVDQQQALVATKRENTRKEKEKKKSNIEVDMRSDAVQDGIGSVDKQGKGKEETYTRNISTSKTGKSHLVRHLETERTKLSIRASPLGSDRHYNRYWFFKREGRLFVENADSREWGYYSSKEELDVLMGSLNVKGIRERALKRQLENFYNTISNALEKRLKDITHKTLLDEAVLRRSTRVRAQPRDSPSMAFLKYVNKWKAN